MYSLGQYSLLLHGRVPHGGGVLFSALSMMMVSFFFFFILPGLVVGITVFVTEVGADHIMHNPRTTSQSIRSC